MVSICFVIKWFINNYKIMLYNYYFIDLEYLKINMKIELEKYIWLVV